MMPPPNPIRKRFSRFLSYDIMSDRMASMHQCESLTNVLTHLNLSSLCILDLPFLSTELPYRLSKSLKTMSTLKYRFTFNFSE